MSGTLERKTLVQAFGTTEEGDRPELYVHFYVDGPAGAASLTLPLAFARTAADPGDKVALRRVDFTTHGFRPTNPYNGDRDDCPFLPGARCYYDGSNLIGLSVWDEFLENGPEALWERLEEHYRDAFEVPIRSGKVVVVR